MKRTWIITGIEARRAIAYAISKASDGQAVTIGDPTRTLAQNANQWPLLEAIADQVLWPVNGAMCRLTTDEFKDILTAAHRKESVRLAAGVDGGVVMLGQRTSKFSKQTFSEWIEYLLWFCAARGVVLEKE